MIGFGLLDYGMITTLFEFLYMMLNLDELDLIIDIELNFFCSNPDLVSTRISSQRTRLLLRTM